jgi:bifunctional non-homologous end joining protein LigD
VKRLASKAKADRASHLKPPPFQPVQLANLVDSVPAGDRWLHEMKYDGYRLLVAVGGGQARAYTRSGLDWSEKFADVVGEAAGLQVRSSTCSAATKARRSPS